MTRSQTVVGSGASRERSQRPPASRTPGGKRTLLTADLANGVTRAVLSPFLGNGAFGKRDIPVIRELLA